MLDINLSAEEFRLISLAVPCGFRAAAKRQLHLSGPAFQHMYSSRDTSGIGLARAPEVRRSAMTTFHNIGVSYVVALGVLALIITMI